MPDKEKTKLVPTSTEKRKADDFEQIKDLKKVNELKKIATEQKRREKKNKENRFYVVKVNYGQTVVKYVP